MPSLFRFVVVAGMIAAVVFGGLYVISVFFEPEPKERATLVPGVKVRKHEGIPRHDLRPRRTPCVPPAHLSRSGPALLGAPTPSGTRSRQPAAAGELERRQAEPPNLPADGRSRPRRPPRPSRREPMRAPPDPHNDATRSAEQPRVLWTSARAAARSSGDLAPVMAPDGSGMPLELWRGH